MAMGVASLQAAYVTVGRSDDYGEPDPRAEADAAAARVAALAALPVVREVTEDACRDLPEVRGGARPEPEAGELARGRHERERARGPAGPAL